MLQFVDAWTNNFAYVGTRATGSGPGRFLIAPPGWTGEPPAGATRITSPTRVCSIVGRLAVEGEADLAAVRAVQQQLSLTPLDPTQRANWLPAPAGDFRPALRIYNPRPEVLDGRYQPPPITRS